MAYRRAHSHSTPSRLIASSGPIPSTLTIFFLEVSPAIIVTDDFEAPSIFARNANRALFAAPSTGAAVSATFTMPSCSPSTLVVAERGATKTRSTTPDDVGSMYAGKGSDIKAQPLRNTD